MYQDLSSEPHLSIGQHIEDNNCRGFLLMMNIKTALFTCQVGKYVVIINLAWYARVIMMDKIPNGPNMIFYLFRKG